MVQVPNDTRVTVCPKIVHTAGVREAKLTGRPELALAFTVNGGVVRGRFGRLAKAMLCLAFSTWKLRSTGLAGAYVASPA